MKIYICSHVINSKVYPDNYEIIYVGKKAFHTSNYLRDDEGINISSKNENYSELTAIYWIWKNTSENIVGLVHYRRFFVKKHNYITDKEIQAIMEDYDMILPKKFRLTHSVYQDYCKFHYKKDIDAVFKIIDRMYPEYSSSFSKVMERNWQHTYNMMITKKDIFNNYCEWLFSILFELDKEISLENYDNYQSRVFGFISERLLDCWIEHNNINYKELDVNWEGIGFFQLYKRQLKQNILRLDSMTTRIFNKE